MRKLGRGGMAETLPGVKLDSMGGYLRPSRRFPSSPQ